MVDNTTQAFVWCILKTNNIEKNCFYSSLCMAYILAFGAFIIGTNLFAGFIALLVVSAIQKELKGLEMAELLSTHLQIMFTLIAFSFLGSFVGTFVSLTLILTTAFVLTVYSLSHIIGFRPMVNARTSTITIAAFIGIITFESNGHLLPNDALRVMFNLFDSAHTQPHGYYQSLSFIQLWSCLALLIELTMAITCFLTKTQNTPEECQ